MSGTVTVGIADGATLTNNSGAILFTANGGAINATGATASGALAFGSAQGIITVNSGLADSISAVITGSNGIAKLGAGTLTLSGTNSYTGGTQILAGQLNLSGFTNPASTGTIFVGATSGSSNASLNLNTATASTVTNNIVVQGGNYGTATIAGGSGISQTDTYSGSITLGSNGIGHNVTLGQLGGGGFNSTTFSGNIADPVGLTGTAGVVTINGNTIRISGNNSYSGGTVLLSGVTIGSFTALGTGTITFQGGSIGGSNFTLANNVVLNSNLATNGASGATILTGNVMLTGNRVFSTTNNSLAIYGVISDNVAGSNFGVTSTFGDYGSNQSLYGANTFEGGVTIGAVSANGGTSGFGIGNFGSTSTASAIGTGTFTINPATGTAPQTLQITNATGLAHYLSTNNDQVWNTNFNVIGSYFDMGTGSVSLGTSSGTSRTLTVGGNSFETDGVISNGTTATGITKAGAGALVFGGNNTYTGATIITAGVLQIGRGGTSGSIGSSASSALADGGTLIIDRSDSFTLGSSIIGNGGTVTGTGAFTQAGTGTLTINNALTYTGTTNVTGGGTLRLLATTGSLSSTALTFSGNGGTYNFDSTGSSGTTAQTFATLTNSAADSTILNTYGSGGTSTLTFTNAATRAAGATVNFVDNGTTSNEIVLSKINATSVAAKTVLDKGYFFNGSNYATSDTGTYIRAYNYSSDTGAVLISSSGTTTLGNVSTNNVQINGNVTAQATAQVNTLNITGTNSLTIATGATTFTVAGILKTGGGASTISSASSTGTLAVGTEGVIRTDLVTDSLTISTNVSGTALTKTGAGTLTLSGTNSYSGATTLNAGTLNINNARALGTTGAVQINGGTIDNTSGAAIAMSTIHPLTLAGDFAFGGTNALDLGTGAVSLGANEGVMRTITVTGTGGGLTIGGNISNGTNTILPTTGIIKAGAGSLSLSGTNAYTGGTVVNGGTLVVGGSAFNSSVQAATVTSTATSSITVVNSTTGLYVGEQVTGGNLNGGTIASITGSNTITVTGGTTSVGNTILTFGVNTSAVGQGNVNVNAGTLVLNGSTLATNNIIVGNNTGVATLAGTGISNGAVTLVSAGSNVAHVAPGATAGTVGTLTIGNLGFTIGGGSALDFDLNTGTGIGGSSNDLIAMTGGTLTFSGTTTFNFNALTSLTSASAYTLINGASSVAGFNAANFLATGTGTLTATFANTGSALTVTFSAGTFTSTTYTLTAGAGATVLHAGGSTSVTDTLTNTGTGTTDSVNYTGLGVTTSSGTLNETPTSGGPVANTGGTGTNTGTFTAGSTGTTVTIGTSVTSVTNANAGGSATLTGTTNASIVVYTGQGVWNTAGNGSWGTASATQTAWTAAGGTPGLDAGFTNTDSATFGTVSGNNSATVSLNGSNPSLNAITFSTSGGGYTLAQGSSGSFTLSNSGSLSAAITDSGTNSASNTISAPIVLASNLNATITDASDTLTISGTVSGSKSVTKNGAGKLILSGANTYTNGTTVNTGTLVVGTSTTVTGSTIQSGAVGTGTLTLASGSTLQDNGTAITLANAVSASGTITFSSTGAGSLTFDGRNLTSPSVFTLTGNTILIVNNTTTIDDNIAGNFTLTKQGNGTLNLLGTSSSTAGTTITSGSITIANGASLGSGLISLANGTGLTYTGGAGTLNQNITVASGATGTVSNTGTATLTLAGTLTKADANLILNAGGHTIDVTGAIVSTGATGTFDSDLYATNGTVIADNSNNSYSGPTHIYGNGTLVNGFNNALPTSTVIELGNSGGPATETGASFTNIYQLNGHNQSIAGLTSANPAGFTDSNHVIGGSATLSTLTLTGTASLGEGILGGTGTNANNLAVKLNPGSGKTITLSGSNTYTGGTEVVDGNLLVNNTTGSATGGGTFKLDSGAGLSGTGTITSTSNTINGNVTVGSGGTNTTDVLTMTASGTTTFSGANLTFNLDANSTNSNVMALGSTPSIYFGSGVTTLTLNLLGTGSTNIANGTDYILFTASSASDYKDLTFSGSKITNFVLTLTGTASNGAANSLYYGQSYLILSGNNIEIQVVPEPGTWALMLGGLALLVAFQRIRRSRNS